MSIASINEAERIEIRDACLTAAQEMQQVVQSGATPRTEVAAAVQPSLQAAADALSLVTDSPDTDALRDDLGNSTDPALGAGLLGYKGRTVYDRLGDTVSVRDYITTAVDGTTSNQAGIQAAVDAAVAAGADLYWPAGTYVSTGNITNLHAVRHFGPGVLKRGSTTFKFQQKGGQNNQLYISPTGSASNDGITSATPLAGIQAAVDVLAPRNRLEGRWQIMAAAGVYNESVSIPDGLAQDANYLEFKFPSAPGLQGDPSAWPAGGAILDGTGLAVGTGFAIGAYNKVYIEYLLIRNFYDTGAANTAQVRRGLTLDKHSFLLGQGISCSGNGIAGISLLPGAVAQVTGGIIDGGRFGIDNTGGELSLTATASTFTTIRNALEYGLYQKHDSRTVMDFTVFNDNGKHPLAADYGAAIFLYKSNASADTRSCTFNRNNIVYNLRGGTLSTHPASTDVMGSGADANGRIWLIKGYGTDDLINYRSLAARDLSLVFTPGTTASTTTATIVDNICTIPAGYLVSPDQYLEIEIVGGAGAGGATIRPTFTSTTPANFAAGAFTIPASTRFRIRLLVYPTGVSAQLMLFDCQGATISSAVNGKASLVVPFGATPVVFKVRGEVPSGSVDVDRVRVVLWG